MVITVSGSSGTIGGELVRLLSAAGAPTRALFRDANRVQPLPGVVWLAAELREQRMLHPALAGTMRLFLLTDNQAGFAELQINLRRRGASFHENCTPRINDHRHDHGT